MKRTQLISILLPIVAVVPIIYLGVQATPHVLAAVPFLNIHMCEVEDSAFASLDGGCKDLATGLVWGTGFDNVTWDQAREFGEDLTDGGFTDWRLPTVEELQVVHRNGAPTHFAEWIFTQIGTFSWSSERRGNKVWYVEYLVNDEAFLIGRNSSMDIIYVREPSLCGNGQIDPGETPCNCPEDAGQPELTETDCSDGIDNDCDGLIDAADPDCGASQPTVVSIDPLVMPAGSSRFVTILGSGYVAGAGVTFENGKGATPIASDIVVGVGGDMITATVEVGTGGPRGARVWDVRITNPDNSTGVLVDGFTVVR